MTNNIPLPADFLEGFKKGKLPKTALEIFAEKTRKPKQENFQVPDSEKVTTIGMPVEPPPHVAKIHNKMTDYISRRMFEKGLDINLWKVGYEHINQGTHIESKLKVAKLGQISDQEKQILDNLMRELDSIPPEVFNRIMGMQ